ncbi:hypothetical protein [Hyalangium rubrum]|uniref:Uncharacterized protein n=1 Tax=Hyalangium rubrum TaxID=3103134 RepID=A0ABU5HCK1_9BACT|nr:hypothetical protein [Hyalangium sp. s54d21]MDY7231184.1 hypothetical protein [Hyalangium sp. s54d21]
MATPFTPIPVSSSYDKAAVDPAVKALVIIGTLFVPLLGIILGAIYLASGSPEKQAVGRLWLIVGTSLIGLYLLCVAAGA